jgi:hypothetical protein
MSNSFIMHINIFHKKKPLNLIRGFFILSIRTNLHQMPNHIVVCFLVLVY